MMLPTILSHTVVSISTNSIIQVLGHRAQLLDDRILNIWSSSGFHFDLLLPVVDDVCQIRSAARALRLDAIDPALELVEFVLPPVVAILPPPRFSLMPPHISIPPRRGDKAISVSNGCEHLVDKEL